MSIIESKPTHKPRITNNFRNGAIFASFISALVAFIITAIYFNGSIWIAMFGTGVLISIILLIIGIWKKRTWALAASITFFYSFAILAISIFIKWPGFLDMLMAGVIATFALLITGIFISIVVAERDWKRIPLFNKIAIITSYLIPYIILIGGYISGLAMELKIKRFNINGETSPATSLEEAYSNAASILIGLGLTAFLIINLMLIYTIIVNHKAKKLS